MGHGKSLVTVDPEGVYGFGITGPLIRPGRSNVRVHDQKCGGLRATRITSGFLQDEYVYATRKGAGVSASWRTGP